MQSALGAALLGMVARYSTGEKYAEHQETIGRIIAEADELRSIALRLAEADAAAATARVSVEISLAGVLDAQASLEMIAQTDQADGIIARAEQVSTAIREQIRA